MILQEVQSLDTIQPTYPNGTASWLHCDVTNGYKCHSHNGDQNTLLIRYIRTFRRPSFFMPPLWNHYKVKVTHPFLSQMYLLKKLNIQNSHVTMTHFLCHLTAMWKVRAAFRPRWFHFLVGFESRCFKRNYINCDVKCLPSMF